MGITTYIENCMTSYTIYTRICLQNPYPGMFISDRIILDVGIAMYCYVFYLLFTVVVQ